MSTESKTVMQAGAVVRIGVTGHRFLAELEKLRAGIRAALARLRKAFPERRFVCVSALAEGADRLVAEEVLAAGGQLRVVLPLPEEDYRQDFGSAESQAEFSRLLAAAESVEVLPATRTRNEAYAQVGRAVLDAADVLIALWDGQGAQGQGGTGEIVWEALQRGLPVLHIKAGNRKPGTNEPTSLGPEQGQLVVYNLPSE